MSEQYSETKPGDDPGITIDELAERYGVSVRAIRFYIQLGLLPGPGSRGKSATYGEEHLVRLGLIRRLTDRHMPLAKIQELLRGLSLEEVKALQFSEDSLESRLVEAERRQSPQDYVAALLDDARRARRNTLPQPAPSPDISDMPGARLSPAKQGVAQSPWRKDSETWYRWTLAPGIELHVSAQAMSQFSGLLRAVLHAARKEGGGSEG